MSRVTAAFLFVSLPLAAALAFAESRASSSGLQRTRRAPPLSMRSFDESARSAIVQGFLRWSASSTIGVNAFFSFGAEADFKNAQVVIGLADQGGLGLPERDYYTRDDPKSVELRTQYLDHVAKMTALAVPAADAAAAKWSTRSNRPSSATSAASPG
jgi:predicted metalloendopeptidase